MNNTGLYIHVPFCISKCSYCDFYSIAVTDELKKSYKDAVIRNIKHYGNAGFDTVYFGGGTPILLWKEICDILQETGDRLNKNCEVTIEANPCSTTVEALRSLKSSGVNRVSFGLQSGVDNELKSLGRRHNTHEGSVAVNGAYNAGITNISGDIMLGIPCQTKKSLDKTLEYMANLPLSHISAYMLKIEENTPFAKMGVELPDDEQFSDYYIATVEFLAKHGFNQYEISNFSKTNCESRHNLRYWRCEDYIGIGPSAHSYYDGKRFATERNVNEFIASPIQKTYITDEAPGDFSEWAMLKLRLCEGINFDECYERFGVGRDKIIKRLKLVPENLYLSDENSLRLTPYGFMISNAVIGIITDI